MDKMTVKGKEFGIISSFDDMVGEAIDATADCISELMKNNAAINDSTVKSAKDGDTDAVIKMIDISINSSLVRGDIKYKMMAAITTSDDMDYTKRLEYFRENATLKNVKEARGFFLSEILPHAMEL